MFHLVLLHGGSSGHKLGGFTYILNATPFCFVSEQLQLQLTTLGTPQILVDPTQVHDHLNPTVHYGGKINEMSYVPLSILRFVPPPPPPMFEGGAPPPPPPPPPPPRSVTGPECEKKTLPEKKRKTESAV